jgi:hypothetical protein
MVQVALKEAKARAPVFYEIASRIFSVIGFRPGDEI